MKISINQIKGKLKTRVENVINACSKSNKIIIGLFAFNDIDHEYSFRSKGKYVAVRWKYENSGIGEYHDTKIYYKENN